MHGLVEQRRTNRSDGPTTAATPWRRGGWAVGSALALVAWGGALVGGYAWLVDHATRPGAAGAAPARWPTSVPSLAGPDEAALLVFLHGECPCSPATVRELGRALATATDAGASSPRVVALFAPVGRPETSATWTALDLLPGVERRTDDGGRLAATFGARTSGHVVLYGADGALRFAGGVTAARGHLGPNAGADALAAALAATRPAAAAGAAVFGCPLTEAAAERPDAPTLAATCAPARGAAW